MCVCLYFVLCHWDSPEEKKNFLAIEKEKNAERFSSSCVVLLQWSCRTTLELCVWDPFAINVSISILSYASRVCKIYTSEKKKKKGNKKKSYKEKATVGGMMMTCWRVSIITLDRIQKKPYFNMFRCAYKRHVRFFLLENTKTKYKKVKQIHRTERRLFLSREK